MNIDKLEESVFKEIEVLAALSKLSPEDQKNVMHQYGITDRYLLSIISEVNDTLKTLGIDEVKKTR